MAIPTPYVIAVAPLVWVIVTIVRAIRSYRRLSHIPGPPLATVSRLWILKGVLGTRNHLNLFETSLKYGPLARIAPNRLLTSDPELVRRMYAPRSPYRRGPWYTAFQFKPGVENVFTERREKEHDDLRKKMHAGYAGKENPQLETEIDERIRDLINLIERKYICTDKEPARLMDFARKVQFFTLDVISGLAFDQNFGNLAADEDKLEYIKTVEDSMPVILSLSELLEVRSFLEKSSLLKWMAPSATDKIGFGKLIGIATEKVAERFGDQKMVKQDMLGSFVRHGLNQKEAESEGVFQM